MRKTVLQLGRLVACTSLLFGALTSGYAQQSKSTNQKFKAALELRELVNKSTTASRTATVGGVQKADMLQVKGTYVVIEAVSNETDGRGLLQQLQKLGLKNGSSYGRMVSGLFPIGKISQLEGIEPLRYAVPSYEPIHNVGLTTSQGDVSLGADKVRTTLAVTGVGSKVGVLSDSYGAIAGGPAAGVASGDLPNDVQVLEDAPGFSDEGRAMAEIVHDVAPGAKIAFNTAFLGQASFANGIQRLADNGCNIIVDDVYYFAEPFFQDGIIAQSVDRVVDRNVSYFSAAGNSARRSYESGFRNSGQAVVVGGVNYGVAHDFGGGDIRQTITIPANGQLRLSLQWADPFFSVSGGAGAQTDLDILVFFNGALAFSSRNNNIGADPYEFIGLNAGTAAATGELVIVKRAGPDPELMKYIEFGNSTIVEYNTNGSTVVGHNNAAKTISVGASPWYNTPQFNTNITRPVVESFSSLGGTPVFITTTGVNTGNDPSKIRRNPSVVGPDGGNNTFFGSDTSLDTDVFPNFFGTSAAAPHVAAVAALMQQAAGNTLTPQRVKDALTSTALDMDDPFTVGVFDTGYDFRTGFGFVRAEQAIAAVANPCLNDVTPPTILAAGFIVALDANGVRTIEAADVDYGSTDNCGVASMTLDKTRFTCANIGPNQVTLTVRDNAGNVATQAVTVLVVDNTAPTILAAGFQTQLQNGTRTIQAADIDYGSTDNCGIASVSISPSTFTCANVGPNPVTITVRDNSGNVATQTVTVIIQADATCTSSIASNAASGASLSNENQLQAYPNPVTDQATVSFRPTQTGTAQVKVYNQLGVLVATLYDGQVEASRLYSATLNGQPLAAGVYNCQLITNGKVTNQRLLVSK
ncbi:S8 family serine peptidase [Hymenobacter sp. BT186]|uniref:S8 family serine peptidase n=1 Tax=Hymenobacter telluris TaxID=2816474 RepID=A0A939JD19_9BACT|nr:S8 family serine peptidase [Hymenobacter telluris]MBO0357882.1 S8 family serine peptidase [Hymenobacter telluris]MBW3373909.1 S8 family serine peptidase [Hymenobacter norwichensis]